MSCLAIHDSGRKYGVFILEIVLCRDTACSSSAVALHDALADITANR